MRAKPLCWFLAFVVWGVYQLQAQQSELDLKWLGQIGPKAEQGDAKSQYLMGYALSLSQVVKGEVEAVEWFRKAAAQNYAPAESRLGLCYLLGKGVPQNKEEGPEVVSYVCRPK